MVGWRMCGTHFPFCSSLLDFDSPLQKRQVSEEGLRTLNQNLRAQPNAQLVLRNHTEEKCNREQLPTASARTRHVRVLNRTTSSATLKTRFVTVQHNAHAHGTHTRAANNHNALIQRPTIWAPPTSLRDLGTQLHRPPNSVRTAFDSTTRKSSSLGFPTRCSTIPC